MKDLDQAVEIFKNFVSWTEYLEDTVGAKPLLKSAVRNHPAVAWVKLDEELAG